MRQEVFDVYQNIILSNLDNLNVMRAYYLDLDLIFVILLDWARFTHQYKILFNYFCKNF